MAFEPNNDLPELPEKYFWRILPCNNPFSNKKYELQIRKRGRLISHEVVALYCSAEEMIGHARYLSSDLVKNIEQLDTGILGDYPAKKKGGKA